MNIFIYIYIHAFITAFSIQVEDWNMGIVEYQLAMLKRNTMEHGLVTHKSEVGERTVKYKKRFIFLFTTYLSLKVHISTNFSFLHMFAIFCFLGASTVATAVGISLGIIIVLGIGVVLFVLRRRRLRRNVQSVPIRRVSDISNESNTNLQLNQTPSPFLVPVSNRDGDNVIFQLS